MIGINLVVWALLTGGITGGAWVAIVLVGQRRSMQRQLAAIRELEARIETQAENNERFAGIEERLAFTERLLAQTQEVKQIKNVE